MKVEKKEVNCIVLDVLAKGHPEDPRPPFKREPLVQAMGLEQFKLLELVPKPGTPIDLYEKLYIAPAGEPEEFVITPAKTSPWVKASPDEQGVMVAIVELGNLDKANGFNWMRLTVLPGATPDGQSFSLTHIAGARYQGAKVIA